MNFDDVDDDEFRLLMTAPVDNLKKQRARAGIGPLPAKAPKAAGLDAMSDDDFIATMTKPAAKAPIRELERRPDGSFVDPKTPVKRADDFTAEELYSLGSSPETLRAKLAPHSSERHAPGILDRIAEPWKNAVRDPKGEALRELNLAGSALTRAADAASVGAYSKLRNLIGGAVAPRATAEATAQEDRFDREHPFASGLAAGVGYMTPMGAPNMIARAATPIAEGAARAVPRLLERPVAGAVSGALTAGGTAAAEAATAGAPASEVGRAALRGGVGGAAIGGGLGAVQGALGRLAEGADRRVTERNIADFTEGASATRRDRVIGKGGEKVDRIDALARRTPELDAAGGVASKQAPVVQNQIDRVGSQIDEIIDGVPIRPHVITGPMREVAAEIRSRPHTGQQAAEAEALEREAQRVEEAWSGFSKKGRGIDRPVQPESAYTQGTSVGVTPREPTVRMSHDEIRGVGYRERGYQPPPEVGYIDARPARQMITDYGKGLYGGNPNNAPTISKAIRQEVYRRQVDALGRSVETLKPGVREELNAANAEMSDWLNIRDAVGARAAREQTPSMSLHSRAHNVLDTALAVMHPGHFLAKKAVDKIGPGALRFADKEIAAMGAPDAILQTSHPLLRAAAAERERSKQKAEYLKRSKKAKADADWEDQNERARQMLIQAISQQNDN